MAAKPGKAEALFLRVHLIHADVQVIRTDKAYSVVSALWSGSKPETEI